MDNIVSLVTRLQAACTVLGDGIGKEDRTLPSLWDRLPSIVVIGGQSSGKSSVLEAVVGKDFLPRGSGIVTRRPLVVQLVHLDDPNAKEYGEFMHSKGRIFHDFKMITQEIDDETARHLGSLNIKAVSPDPIYLTVYSPYVPHLTLVDMPGLTKVPIDGQPKSIVQDIEKMVLSYIKGENVIILAVSPANADLATSDALRMAREVDPNGDRTIGVLTKLDIMDPGTSVRTILDGSQLKLKHGWVGVINRGQRDINSNASMAAAREKEKQFFDSTPEYSDLHNVGTTYLANKLSNHLLNEIKKALPSIQASIKTDILNLEKEMKMLGPSVMESRGQMMHFILKRCREFESAYMKLVTEGKGGGENILDVFDNKLYNDLHALPFEEILKPDNVRKIISMADGVRPHLIAPEAGYRRLLAAGLKIMKDPAQSAVDEVHRILQKIIDMALNSEECRMLTKYTVLATEISNAAVTRLESVKDGTREMVKTLVEMEASYLSANVFRKIMEQQANTNSDARNALFKTLSGRDIERTSDDLPQGTQYVQQIAKQVSAYLNYVRTQLLNTIPKAVIHTQVLNVQESMLENFEEEIAMKDEMELSRLLQEDPNVTKRRSECTRRLKLLNNAAKEIAAARF